jgi:hypothetical protein
MAQCQPLAQGGSVKLLAVQNDMQAPREITSGDA